MKKVLVIGCPGSGKSTFARRLHGLTELPLYYLDMVFHKEDRTTLSREEFDKKLSEILSRDLWIIDGNYLRTMETRLEKADTVFFLDYPTQTCLEGIKERVGHKREDMPWVEKELDEEFAQFVTEFSIKSRPKILELLNRFENKNIYVFKNREESELYLQDFKK